ncbi:MAG: hypothetical protein LBH98_08030 [Chitinispirillales bacterium]|jgi:hypothetical protein|nr:hypothetical protein [Chitinispirillales bacterium]
MISADKLFSKTNSDLTWALWNWNGNVCVESIKKQLASFVKDGFNGIIIRPCSNISCGFMTDEFLEFFTIALILAKKEKIHVMLADDFNRPADSLFYSTVAKEKNYRSERLVLSKKIFCKGGAKFEFEPDIFSQNYIAAVPAESRKISLAGSTVIFDGKHFDKSISWTAPAGNDWLILKFTAEYEKNRDSKYIPNMYNIKLAQTYCGGVLQKILETARSVDKTTFKGFMFEMPAIIPCEHGIPWDREVIASKYLSRFKKDITALLPALFLDGIDDALLKCRPHIYNFLWESVCDRFPAIIQKWCEQESVQMWLISQDSDMRNVKCDGVHTVLPSIGQNACGTAFRSESHASQTAFIIQSEISRSNGIETIGIVGRDSTMKSYSIGELKSIIDWQILFGADKIVIDGFYLNPIHRYEDYAPPGISFNHPDYRYLKDLVVQCKRALSINYARKTSEFGVAIISPSQSLIADYTLGDNAVIDEAIETFLHIIYDLRTYQIPYTIITEEDFVKNESTEITAEGYVKTACGLYSAVILPYVRLLNNSFFAQIERMVIKKGIVLFTEKKPAGTFDEGQSEIFEVRINRMLNSNIHHCIVGNVPDIVDLIIKSNENIVKRVHIEKGNCGVLVNHYPIDKDFVTTIFNTSNENVPIEITRTENKHFLKVDVENGQFVNVDSAEDKGSFFNFLIHPREQIILLETTITNVKTLESLTVQKLDVILPEYSSNIGKERGIFETESLNRFPLSRWKSMVSVNRDRNIIHYNYEAVFESDCNPETAILVFYDNIPDWEKILDDRFKVKINGIEVQRMNPNSYPQYVEDPNLLAYDISYAIIKDKTNFVSIRKSSDADLPDPIKYPPFVLVSSAVEKGQNNWKILDVAAAKQCAWDTKGYPYLIGRGSSVYYFEAPKNYRRIVLAFDDLSGATNITLNDKDYGEEEDLPEESVKKTPLSHMMIFPPYRVDITDFVNDKRNILTLTSSNTLTSQNRLEPGKGGAVGSVYLEIIMKE